MSDRQQTGVWFIVTGVLLLSLWILSYPIANWSIDSHFFPFHTEGFSNEQQYILGGSAVIGLQLTSLTGIPLVLTGLAQIIVGKNKDRKKNSKK